MTKKPLYINYNNIDNRWKVIDKDGFCFGDGTTPDSACDSARIVTNDIIYTDDTCTEIYDNIPLADRQAEEMEAEMEERIASYMGE